MIRFSLLCVLTLVRLVSVESSSLASNVVVLEPLSMYYPTLESIDEDASVPDRCRFAPSPRTIVLIVTEGLGNRLFTIAEAVDKAYQSKGGMDMRIHWPKTSIVDATFEDLFRISNPVDVTLVSAEDIRSRRVLRRRPVVLFCSIGGKRPCATDRIAREEYGDDFVAALLGSPQDAFRQIRCGDALAAATSPLCNTSLWSSMWTSDRDIVLQTHVSVGFLAGCPKSEMYTKFFASLRPAPRLRPMVEETCGDLIFGQHDIVLGLHVRTRAKKQYPALQTEDILDRATRFLLDSRVWQGRRPSIFVASDDVERTATLALNQRFPGRILWNQRPTHSIDDAVVDMFCLARTKLIFITINYSSFSLSAARIGQVHLFPLADIRYGRRDTLGEGVPESTMFPYVFNVENFRSGGRNAVSQFRKQTDVNPIESSDLLRLYNDEL